MTDAHALQGRVFARHRAFTALPEVQQQRVLALADTLFRGAFASVREIESARLVDAVATAAAATDATSGEQIDAAASATAADVLVDQLVLSNRIALAREDDASSTQLSGFARAGVVFVPTAPVSSSTNPLMTVSSVQDGAIQAGTLKRAGKVSKVFGGKHAYVVVNEKLQTLFWFTSDAPTAVAKGQVTLAGAAVQFDAALAFGIKVSKEKTVVYLRLSSKSQQDEWLNAIINAGATYREAYNVHVESVQSIYELKDFDMSGQEVSMDAYKGKVLLIVNVSSKCGLTPTNYPELAELDRKYRDEGLAILAFPCNQFANQEPGTHDEILEFVKQYKCEFPFFEKHDVNGADARPVFTYLKAKLPGSFGNFVKWNFTKFLVDRNGQPYKRFSPYDLPSSFEADIQALLVQKEGEEAPLVTGA